ncbi:MAG: Hsp20/alpha crystallin family protein [Christensenellales bacterium]|jgi:HSP20 family protein
MSSLIPYHRYRQPRRSGDALSLFQDDFFRPFFFGGDAMPASFRVDVKDEGEQYVMEAELPGISRDHIKIDVDDGVLTIIAEWKQADKEGRGEYLVSERRAGRVQRSFTLENVLEDQITAEYSDGVLRLTMPKREEIRRTPRRIELQ